jgi:hypothetical protein
MPKLDKMPIFIHLYIGTINIILVIFSKYCNASQRNALLAESWDNAGPYTAGGGGGQGGNCMPPRENYIYDF